MIQPAPSGIVLHVLVAALLGGAIGVQRQAAHKPAGFRTHVLVALGSCGFMEISQLLGDTRVVAGVVTGIGFLGAGAIVRAGLTPHGLTTAASIWTVAALGAALGIGSPGSYVLAGVLLVATLVSLSFSDERITALFPARPSVDLDVTCDLDTIPLDNAVALFRARTASAKLRGQLCINRVEGRHLMTFGLGLEMRSDALAKLMEEIGAVPGIEKLELVGEITGPST